MKAFALLTLGLLLLPRPAIARSGKLIRTFAELKKITVGPSDNFQSSVAEDKSILFFTRGQNLSSQIMMLDLKTGLQSPITPPEADAKNPAVSPDGSTIAMTYFGQDAKGDICLIHPDKNITCITGPGRGEHSPFWLDNNRIGYVQSNDQGTEHRVFSYDKTTKSSTLLLAGHIYGPSFNSHTGLIVYKAETPEFVIFNPQTQKELQRISIKLPGTSGSARFSADGGYVYFSQYMVDSNRDLVLDSRDASAIFRVAIKSPDQHPEQLTSLDQNCSYPTPGTKELFLTCAFEGTLDVYRAPLEGIVPQYWTTSDLWEAHRAARTYSDKILILNQIAARSKAPSNADLAERVFDNFVFMHAWMPAMLYAETLKSKSQDYEPQIVLLETLTKWDALPSKENVAELSRLLDTQTAKLKQLPATAMRQIAEAHLAFFGHHEQEALAQAKSIQSSDQMVLYWQTKLMERILDNKPGTPFLEVLLHRATASDTSEEARFYYLSRLLGRLEDDTNRDRWLSKLETALKPQSDKTSLQLLELCAHERQLYQLSQAKNQTETRDHMRQIVDRIKKVKDEYFSLRLLFARSVIVMNNNNRPKELSRIMNLWLSYIKIDSKEYPYAIEALRRTTLDAAYKFYNGPADSRDFAKGAFFDNIRTTDDLESHYQYTLLNSTQDAWQELLKAYEPMTKDGLIETDSLVFVKAVHNTLGSGKSPSQSVLTEATAAIEKLSDNVVGVGVKYLFLGYLYHQQLLRTVKDFAVDPDLAEKTHRSYLYAIDAAWNNDRIQAAALQNLGLLHTKLRNYSMAAEFFQKRHGMPFENPAHQEAVFWFEANSLYQSYRPNDALHVIEEALTLNVRNRTAFTERQAFYSWNAGQHQKAAGIYSSLIPQLGKKAHSGIYLSYGYALMKAGDAALAETQFNEAILRAGKESSMTRSGIVRSPEKIAFTAKGLLARLPLAPEKRTTYLASRLAQFEGMIASAKKYYMDATTLRAQQVKEHFDLVLLSYEGKIAPREILQRLATALELARAFGDDNGYLNQTIFVTLKNAMILSKKADFSSDPQTAKLAKDLFQKAGKEFAAEKNPSNQLRKQWAEVQLVEIAHRLNSGTEFAKRFAEESDKLLTSPHLSELEKDRQDLFAEIKAYRDGIVRTL